MPEKKTKEAAERDKAEGKAPSTQAGEFVKEEIHHVREGKHGARNTKQAIAIGLSKARRAGVKLPAPRKGKASESTRRKAKKDTAKGAESHKRASPRRSRATTGALRREGKSAASKRSLSRQGKSAAARRTKADRSAAAKKGAATRKRNREKRQEEQARAHS